MVTRKKPEGISLDAEAYTLLTQSINVLTDRIAKTETDFVGHLKKVEDRLDQIVDLTRTVAVLQTQSASVSDSLVEVRTSHRDYAAKNDQSIARIHTRIEEVQNHNRDKMELAAKEQELAIKPIREKVESTDANLKQWLNRGFGAWAIFVLVIAGVNTALWRWVDSLEKDRIQIVQQIETNKREHVSYDNKIQLLELSSRETSENIKRLNQIASDTDRQLEFLRNKNK